MKKEIRYEVYEKGTDYVFGCSGYSKYFSRMSLQNARKLPRGQQIYGLPQAKEHLRELQKFYTGDKFHTADNISVRKVTTISEDVFKTKSKAK
jgi:hypothetical protein